MGKLLPQVARAELFPDRTAIADAAGVHTYRELLDQSRAFAQRLLDGCRDLEESRVAFLVPPGFPYPVVQWGIWQAGGIAVPLGLGHPLPELEYVLQDSGAAVLVADGEREAELHTLARRLNLRFLPASAPLPPPADLPPLGVNRRAQILYTSGTTSRPKGVVTTHRNLQAQMEALIAAWEWAPVDRILHVLPLHHIHGILNVLGCALGSGATCEFLHPFDPVAVWQRFAAGDEELTSPAGRPAPVSLFMAVPTLYSRLIAAWEAAG
ncbi:MAG: AMP-binding protein, partial [Armatimonadetes bacterium]|nr:AMP-binding protein [Armatimonadota bacterium]